MGGPGQLGWLGGLGCAMSRGVGWCYEQWGVAAMRRGQFVTRVLTVAVLLAFPFCGRGVDGGGTSSPRWALLLYLNADHSMSHPFLGVLEDVAAAEAHSGVDVWALVDQFDASPVPVLDQDPWSCPRLFRFASGRLVPMELQGISGEANMGAPGTLTAFLRAALPGSRAEHVCLWILGHGQGAAGTCVDSNRGVAPAAAGQLGVEDLGQALSQGLVGLRSGLELVAFTSCHSGCVEVLAGLAPYCRHVVASESFTCMRRGIDATAVVEAMARNPTASPQAVAEVMVSTYRLQAACGHGVPDMGQSIQHFDLCMLPRVQRGLDALGIALSSEVLAGGAAVRDGILRARGRAARFQCGSQPGPGDCGDDDSHECCYWDLQGFCSALGEVGGALRGRQVRQVVRDAGVMIRSWVGDGPGAGGGHAATGLSLYVPCVGAAIDGEVRLLGWRAAGWGAFLRALFPRGCEYPAALAMKVGRVPCKSSATPHSGLCLAGKGPPGSMNLSAAWLRVRQVAPASGNPILLDLPLDLAVVQAGDSLYAEWDGRLLSWHGTNETWPLQSCFREPGPDPGLWGVTPVDEVGASGVSRLPLLAHLRIDSNGEGRVVTLQSDPSTGGATFVLGPGEVGRLALRAPVRPASGPEGFLLAPQRPEGEARGIRVGWTGAGSFGGVRLSFLVRDLYGRMSEHPE